MSDKKTIVIMGATGAQGGGLVRAMLGDPEKRFAVRAVTRNPDSDKGKELASMGAQVVGADMDEPATVKKAFEGAFGAFCVTNYWEHLSVDREQAQVRAMAEAAREAKLEHVIWSTLEDTREWVPLSDDRMPTLAGKYKVPHFDSKGEADAYFKEAGVPTTYLWTSFYWDNFIHFGMGPRKGPDGKLAITLPMEDKKLPGIATEDIGKCAFGIFKKGNAYLGKHVGIAGEHVTGAEMAASMGRALGQDVVYNAVPPEMYRGFGFPGAEDLGNMFQFKAEFQDVYLGHRDLKESRALNPELKTFDTWMDKNKGRIPLE